MPCLFFMFAIFEYGRSGHAPTIVIDATREGARYAVANTNTQPTPNLQTYITTYLAGQPLTITRSTPMKRIPNNNFANLGPWQNAPFGMPIVVQVQATYTPMLPSFGFLPNPVPLNGEATMYSEAF